MILLQYVPFDFLNAISLLTVITITIQISKQYCFHRVRTEK